MPIAPEYLHLVHPGVTFNALLYGRASRDPKKKGRSVADQIATGSEMCERFNWPIVEVFDQDVDRSASRHARRQRKDFEALLTAIEARKARIVVAFEASRYYRDIEAYIRLRNACMEADVLLCYNGQVYDLSKREDRKATAQDAIAAEDEAEGIRERVIRTTRSQAKKGAPHGRILWGYARRYDEESGDLIEQYAHPERGRIVTEIFQRVAAGETEYSILGSLRGRGEWKPGQPWKYYHLTRIIRNPGYLGQRVHQGEVIGKASWPALVDQETWDTVQGIIANPARTTTTDKSVKHLLSGIATCGYCPDRPIVKVAKTRTYLAYQCSTAFNTVIKKELLDAYVEYAVRRWLASPAATLAFQSTEQADRARGRLRGYEAQLEQARGLASEFDDDGAPKLSIASLASLEARLAPLMQAARADAQEVQAPPLVRSLVGQPDVDERWGQLPVEAKRTVLRAIVNVQVNRASSRGRRGIEPGRVTLTWFGEEGFIPGARRGL